MRCLKKSYPLPTSALSAQVKGSKALPSSQPVIQAPLPSIVLPIVTLHFFYCKCFLARIRKVFEQLILIHTIDRTGIRHLTF